MEKTIFFLAIAVMALSACSKEEPDPKPVVGETKEVQIDATSNTAWHYFAFAENKIVGSEEESVDNNAKWGARKDWDVAFCKYHIRTNSGAFTKANAQGGVYIFKTKEMEGHVYVYDDANSSYEKINSVPAGITFATDTEKEFKQMGGIILKRIQSEASSVTFKMKLMDKEKDIWGKEMPPVYLKAPLCLFRSADGKKVYKVHFKEYLNADAVSGHITLRYAEIE